jgi:hypothetical protein
MDWQYIRRSGDCVHPERLIIGNFSLKLNLKEVVSKMVICGFCSRKSPFFLFFARP